MFHREVTPARSPLTPRQNWQFTPELQWQSRGQRRILQGLLARSLTNLRFLAGPLDEQPRNHMQLLKPTFLSLKPTFLSYKLTVLSYKPTFLSYKLTVLSYKLTVLSLSPGVSHCHPCQIRQSPLGCHCNSGVNSRYQRGMCQLKGKRSPTMVGMCALYTACSLRRASSVLMAAMAGS
jgi:hypothetical protein